MLAGGLTNQNDLDTEVGILESPSILMPIFKYANELKNIKESNQEIFFNSWKKNLQFKVKQKTAILNISYRDEDKSIILPVLEKISSTYQEYSGRSKKRNIELASKYLIDQINLYQDKSSKSLKNAQEFAIEQDLSILDISTSSQNNFSPQFINNLKSFQISDVGSTQSLVSNTDIENIRVKSS